MRYWEDKREDPKTNTETGPMMGCSTLSEVWSNGRRAGARTSMELEPCESARKASPGAGVPLQNSIRARTPSIVSHLTMGRLRKLRIDWKKSVLMGMSDYAGLGIRGDSVGILGEEQSIP